MDEISRADLALALRGVWRLKVPIIVTALAVLFLGLALIEAAKADASYRASATVCATFNAASEQVGASNVISSYADIVTSERVCATAASSLTGLGLDAAAVQGSIGIEVDSGSAVMTVSATAASPQQAIQIANAVAEAFVAEVSVIAGNSSLQVLDQAKDAQALPGMQQSLALIAAAAVFVLLCIVIAVRELASGALRSVSQCPTEEGEILAIIPKA